MTMLLRRALSQSLKDDSPCHMCWVLVRQAHKLLRDRSAASAALWSGQTSDSRPRRSLDQIPLAVSKVSPKTSTNKHLLLWFRWGGVGVKSGVLVFHASCSSPSLRHLLAQVILRSAWTCLYFKVSNTMGERILLARTLRPEVSGIKCISTDEC